MGVGAGVGLVSPFQALELPRQLLLVQGLGQILGQILRELSQWGQWPRIGSVVWHLGTSTQRAPARSQSRAKERALRLRSIVDSEAGRPKGAIDRAHRLDEGHDMVREVSC